MTNQDPTNDPRLATLLREYADLLPDRQSGLPATVRPASTLRLALPGAAALGLAVLLIGSLVLMRLPPLGAAGVGPASSCSAEAWPDTPISCSEVYRIGSQAGAQVDGARIWLTTLVKARQELDWPRQVTEPVGETAAWVIVYNGRWMCCPNAYDAAGRLITQRVKKQWLVVADATTEGSGFIFLGDWSDKDAPDVLPRP